MGALSEFDWGELGSRNSQRQRQAVIAANPELLERDLIKNHRIAVGFMDALRQRGVEAIKPDSLPTWGFNCLLRPGDKADLAMMSKSVMSLLASIVPVVPTGANSSR